MHGSYSGSPHDDGVATTTSLPQARRLGVAIVGSQTFGVSSHDNGSRIAPHRLTRPLSIPLPLTPSPRNNPPSDASSNSRYWLEHSRHNAPRHLWHYKYGWLGIYP